MDKITWNISFISNISLLSVNLVLLENKILASANLSEVTEFFKVMKKIASN